MGFYCGKTGAAACEVGSENDCSPHLKAPLLPLAWGDSSCGFDVKPLAKSVLPTADF